MELIILGFCFILISLYGYKAYLLHRGYNIALYSVLFSSFLEFFFRNAIRRDCSTSNLIKTKIGTHKLNFVTIQNDKAQVTSRLVILCYNKGIACISYFHPDGKLKGNKEDRYWLIKKDNQNYKILNPLLECKKYANYLRKLLPDIHVQEIITCTNQSDISKVSCPIYHYSDILDVLKSMNLPYQSDEEIISAYNTIIKKDNK